MYELFLNTFFEHPVQMRTLRRMNQTHKNPNSNKPMVEIAVMINTLYYFLKNCHCFK